MSTVPSFPFPDTGDLRENPAVDIVKFLLGNPVSACFIAQDGKRKKALYIVNGQPIGAKSNQPEETLIRLAKKLKVIDESQFNEITLKMNGGDTRTQGALMTEFGVSEQKINALLVRQTAIRFADLCTWPEGRYRIKREVPETVPGKTADAVTIFVEIGKRIYKPEQFRERMRPVAEAEATVVDQGAKHHQQALGNGDAASVIKLARSGSKTATDLFGDLNAGGKVMNAWLMGYAMQELKILTFAGAPAAENDQPKRPQDAAAVATAEPKAEPKAAPASTPDGIPADPPADQKQRPVRAAKPSPRAPMQPSAGKNAFAPQDIEEERGKHPELDLKYDQVNGKDYYEVLGIARDADGRAVKKAYFKLAKDFHPDRFFDKDTRSPSQMAEKLFSLINRAYEELRETERREMYLHVLERGTTDEEEIKKAEAILASELEFQKAQILIRRKKFGEALGHLNTALELYPEEPDYEIQRAWCRFMSAFPDDKRGYETATINMKDFVARGGRYSTAESWYLYGRMQKISSNPGGAIKAFEKVLELDRKNKDAARELRALKGQ